MFVNYVDCWLINQKDRANKDIKENKLKELKPENHVEKLEKARINITMKELYEVSVFSESNEMY